MYEKIRTYDLNKTRSEGAYLAEMRKCDNLKNVSEGALGELTRQLLEIEAVVLELVGDKNTNAPGFSYLYDETVVFAFKGVNGEGEEVFDTNKEEIHKIPQKVIDWLVKEWIIIPAEQPMDRNFSDWKPSVTYFLLKAKRTIKRILNDLDVRGLTPDQKEEFLKMVEGWIMPSDEQPMDGDFSDWPTIAKYLIPEAKETIRIVLEDDLNIRELTPDQKEEFLKMAKEWIMPSGEFTPLDFSDPEPSPELLLYEDKEEKKKMNYGPEGLRRDGYQENMVKWILSPPEEPFPLDSTWILDPEDDVGAGARQAIKRILNDLSVMGLTLEQYDDDMFIIKNEGFYILTITLNNPNKFDEDELKKSITKELSSIYQSNWPRAIVVN